MRHAIDLILVANRWSEVAHLLIPEAEKAFYRLNWSFIFEVLQSLFFLAHLFKL